MTDVLDKAQFTIKHHDHGISIHGSVPVSSLLDINRMASAQGYTILAPGIARAIGAAFALTSEDGLKAWQAEVDEELKRRYPDNEFLRWWYGYDTGISSKTIASVFIGMDIDRAGLPQDPADFGRCHRLLELFPHWRSRLGEVAAAYPSWSKIVDRWDELEQLYVEEMPSGKCPMLFVLLQDIVTRS